MACHYHKFCKTTYQKLFSEIPIKPASLHLRTYTGEPIDVEGEMTAQVKYASQTKELGLIMVQGDGPSLFGCKWLDHFQLDWNRNWFGNTGNLSSSSQCSLEKVQGCIHRKSWYHETLSG